MQSFFNEIMFVARLTSYFVSYDWEEQFAKKEKYCYESLTNDIDTFVTCPILVRS